MSSVSLNEKIPNNVDLSSDRRLQRALEQWQPGFLAWWREMGPEGFQASDVWLRTAVSVDAAGSPARRSWRSKCPSKAAVSVTPPHSPCMSL